MNFWTALALVALGFILGFGVDREAVRDDVADLIQTNRDKTRAGMRDV